jgi:hypothetical protein
MEICAAAIASPYEYHTESLWLAVANRAMHLQLPPLAVPSVPAQAARLDSLIVSEYPPLFEEFPMKK